MKLLNSLDIKFLNKNIVILLVFGAILFMAIDLRIYNLSKVYTEYDDIGVLVHHKAKAGIREGSYTYKLYEQDITFNWETLRNLEKSYLLPLYIAYGWTYSPGQYFLYPMILSNSDDYEMKVFKGRFVSALASITTIFVLFWIFIKLNNGLNWAVLFPVSIFAFSQNSILYAHHMSPYSTYCLSTTMGLVLIYLSIEKKITTYVGCLLNTVLLYFSYMNILIFLPLLYVEYHRKNLKTFIFSYLAEKKYLLLLNVLLFCPVLFLLKLKQTQFASATRGVGLPQGNDFTNIISIPLHLLNQFFIASRSIFAGFFPPSFSIIFVFLFFFIVIFIAYLFIFKKKISEKVFFYGLVLYLLQWFFFYTLSQVPLDQTRHTLIFFPLLLSVVFVCFNYFKLPNFFYLILFLVLIPHSYGEAKNLIENKTTKFNFELINEQNIEHIFIYSETLSPLLYFDDKKTVLNVDINSFRVAYKKLEMPKNFLLVSQDQPLKTYKETLKERFPEIFKKMFTGYKVETIVEKSTGQYFPYNNYQVSSQQNGFYVYRFSRFG